MSGRWYVGEVKRENAGGPLYAPVDLDGKESGDTPTHSYALCTKRVEQLNRALPKMYARERINSAPPTAERPKCPNCNNPLRPWWQTHAEEKHADGRPGSVTYEVWNGKYHGYGAFCTLRCCESFANAAYKAGYRLKSK